MTSERIERLAAGLGQGLECVTEIDLRTAIAVFRAMIEGAEVGVDEIATRARVSPPAVEACLNRWPTTRRDESGRVFAFWGISTRPTQHRIQVRNESLFAWCAWDAILFAKLLSTSVTVRSRCPVTSARLLVSMREDGPAEMRPTGIVVSFAESGCCDMGGSHVFTDFCSHVRFIASREAAEEWRANRSPNLTLLTVHETWMLAERAARLLPTPAESP